jgi:hypothetical protein
MRTRLMTAAMTALAVAGTMTLNAQTRTPRTGSTSTQTRANRSDSTITVTGCLRDQRDSGGSDASASASASGSGSTAGQSTYTLMNAKIAQGSSTSGIGSASSFQVRGLSDSEMKKHIGHQVQVTGRLSSGMTDSTSSGAAISGTTGSTSGTTGSTSGTTGSTSGTTGSTSGTTGSASGTTGSGSSASGTAGQRTGSGMSGMNTSDMPEIQATSIKMIAATCPAQ